MFLLHFKGILGSGFALQVAQNQKQKHFNRRRVPAALIIQVNILIDLNNRKLVASINIYVLFQNFPKSL